MADTHSFLYDTALFGTTANTEHTLFQVAQGSTATATKAITNMRGAGQLPSVEKFRVDKIHVFADYNSAIADYIDVWVSSFIQFRVSDEILFESPLRMCASMNSFSGFYTQAAAAVEALIGLKGGGFDLKIPIMINGGTAFRVSVFQTTVLSTTSLGVKVALEGILSRPN